MPIFTKQLRFTSGSTEETVREIANHIRFMQDELEYRLANLDSSNIVSINTDETELGGSAVEGLSGITQTVNGLSSAVASHGRTISSIQSGVSSLDLAVSNLESGQSTMLRITEAGLVVVNQSGQQVTIQGSQINAGSLNLTGAITWSDMASDAQDRVNGAINTANGAAQTASGAVSIAQQIANGTYTRGTFINGTSIYSPTIYGNVFSVMPRGAGDTSGSFNLYGYHGASLFQFLQIQYASATPPYINFTSPGGAYAQFNFSESHFYGSVCLPGSYGTSLPGSGKTGQVFFLIQ